MFKTRVKFRVKGQDKFKIGFFERYKHYTSGYRVITPDNKESWDITLLDILEKF